MIWRSSDKRLYRGLSRPYRPGQTDREKLLMGTNFTDCPMAALQYAQGRSGVVLVVDVPEDAEVGITQELWSPDGSGPKRYLLWRAPFDSHIVAQIPAKELRAQIRMKGRRSLPEGDKSQILSHYIETRIARGSPGCGSPFVDRLAKQGD